MEILGSQSTVHFNKHSFGSNGGRLRRDEARVASKCEREINYVQSYAEEN